MYSVGDTVRVRDKFQNGYAYDIVASPGTKFEVGFKPRFSPAKMLEMGVFEGKYCNDCRPELPEDWFYRARISERADVKLNLFGVKSRQPLSVWVEKG